ncbi:MAG: cadherin domain-containing protein [Planctomycetaceae bacterium]|nr:cadherin domain-containing protein [Planctomycetaceae bacterium]
MLLNAWLSKFKQFHASWYPRRRSRRRSSRNRFRTYVPEMQQLEVRTLPSTVPFAPLSLVIDYTESASDPAIRTDGSMTLTSLAANDDGSTPFTSLGFTINLGGTDFTGFHLNNNGNVTFNGVLSAYTPFAITNATTAILAPFFADVDTRGGGGLASYGFTQIQGRDAVIMNWDDVGYFNRKINKLNDFQLVIIDRSDIAAGAFDFEYNYEAIEWEAGDFSGGSNGLGGNSARVGFSDGSGYWAEFIGSGVNGALLDAGTNGLIGRSFGSAVDGRYRFQVRNGEFLNQLSLDDNSIGENAIIGTAVGTFQSNDPESDNTYTYTLPSGVNDNDSFTIVGNELRLNTGLDYEQKTSYTVYVQATNQENFGLTGTITIQVNDQDDTPSDLSLSGNSVAENSSVGTVVGTLTGTDPNPGATLTYSLVSGTGSTDNDSFSIVGDELRTNAAVDFESQSSYSIRVRVTDETDLTYEEVFTINVTDVQETPSDIVLSQNSVPENSASGTTVGSLTTTDPDTGESFTYSLVTGTGDTDNGVFTIVGNQLKTAAVFNFETKSSYSIRIRTTDSANQTYEEVFTINVTNVQETPTDISLSNDTQIENAAHVIIGSFVTMDDDTGESFTYTIRPGGDGNQFAISGSTLRVGGTGLDFEAGATRSVTIRSTDQDGLFYDETFTIHVSDINEAPVLAAGFFPQLPDWWRFSETNPGETVTNLIASVTPNPLITDQDAGALKGFAVIDATNSKGNWEYSTDGGTTWSSLADTSTTNARLLNENARIRFVPSSRKFKGEVSLTIVAWDQTSGVNGGTADATVRGGMSAFSLNSTEVKQRILKKRPRI